MMREEMSESEARLRGILDNLIDELRPLGSDPMMRDLIELAESRAPTRGLRRLALALAVAASIIIILLLPISHRTDTHIPSLQTSLLLDETSEYTAQLLIDEDISEEVIEDSQTLSTLNVVLGDPLTSMITYYELTGGE